jgi:hypothetical protein
LAFGHFDGSLQEIFSLTAHPLDLAPLGRYAAPNAKFGYGENRVRSNNARQVMQTLARTVSNSKYEIDFEKKIMQVLKSEGYGCAAVIVSEKPPGKNMWLRC